MFDTRKGLELVSRRMAGDPLFQDFAPFVFAKTLADVAMDFVTGWRQFDNENPVPLFADTA